MHSSKYCSPTRSSILSGRLPVHVTQYCNYEVTLWEGVYDFESPCSIHSGPPICLSRVFEALASPLT